MLSYVRLALTTLFLSSTLAVADPVTKWTFAGVTGKAGRISGRDLQSNGLWTLGADGSFDLFNVLALQGDVNAGRTKINASIDTRDAGVGVALHLPIGGAIDLYAPLQYRYLRTDVDGSSDDQSGYLLGLGLRGMANEFVEYQLEVTHVDFGTDQGVSLDDQSVNANLRWHVSRLFSFAIGLEVTSETDRQAFTGDFRFSF
ncbi:MAG: outer membrane beta-barrel protein [Gammaproteobacteria bacterium]